MDMIHQLHHLLGVAGNGRVDYHRPVGKSFVPGSQKFRCVFHINRQPRFAAHIDFNLHTRSIGTADPHEIDAVKSFLPDLVDNLLNLRAKRQRSVNAVNRFLFVKSPQAGAIRFFPRFRFVHIMHFPFICFIIALACTKKHNYELWRLQA